MHNYSLLEEDIKNEVWIFESLEKLRASCDRKLTQLAKRRQCVCSTFYYPRVAKKKCPDCGKKLKSVAKVMTCPACGYKAGELGCPQCKDKEHFTPAPKDHKHLREYVVPQLKGLEGSTEERVIQHVKGHPVWDWAKGVPGMGPTSVGRMISACNIEKCVTLSKFKSHYGWGLNKDGTVQRKIKGEKINYDTRAQSIAHQMATSLERQEGKYYDFYEEWKQENLDQGLSEGRGTSRAFRNMLQLALSHFYEVWRKGVGLPYSEPYAYTVLRPPHDISGKIDPWVMTGRSAKGVEAQKRRQIKAALTRQKRKAQSQALGGNKSIKA